MSLTKYGLDTGIEQDLEEVGQQFDVSRERIRQIEGKVFRKLRHPSRAEALRVYLSDALSVREEECQGAEVEALNSKYRVHHRHFIYTTEQQIENAKSLRALQPYVLKDGACLTDDRRIDFWDETVLWRQANRKQRMMALEEFVKWKQSRCAIQRNEEIPLTQQPKFWRALDRLSAVLVPEFNWSRACFDRLEAGEAHFSYQRKYILNNAMSTETLSFTAPCVKLADMRSAFREDRRLVFGLDALGVDVFDIPKEKEQTLDLLSDYFYRMAEYWEKPIKGRIRISSVLNAYNHLIKEFEVALRSSMERKLVAPRKKPAPG